MKASPAPTVSTTSAGIAGVAIDLVAGDQQTSLRAERDGDKLHGKLIDDLPCAVQQEVRRDARRIRETEQGEHLGHLVGIQLKDGRELERLLDDLRTEERSAQIHIEDADTFRARLMQKTFDGAARGGRALRQAAEANGIRLLREGKPVGSELQEVPCDGLMNGELRLTGIERHRHGAGDTAEIFLDIARVYRSGLQKRHGLATERICADSSGNCAVIAEARRHDGEVGDSPAKLRSFRKHVPQQLTETDHGLTLAHGTPPTWPRMGAGVQSAGGPFCVR